MAANKPTLHAKIRMYRNIVRSVYAYETWTPTAKEVNKLLVRERKIRRFMEGPCRDKGIKPHTHHQIRKIYLGIKGQQPDM